MIKSKKVPLSQFITLQRGYDLTKKNMNGGNYPVVGSTSIIGYHDSYKVDSPGVVTGRSGSLGTVQFLNTKFWPHNTSLWVKDFKGNDPSFVYYSLKNLPLADFNAGAGVPTLNRNHLDQLMVTYFPVEYQKKVSLILRQFDDLIKNNNRRVEILEEVAQRLYEKWFVHFRFPGHEEVEMSDGELGRKPANWNVQILEKVAEIRGGYAYKKNDLSNNNTVNQITTMGVVKVGKRFNKKSCKALSISPDIKYKLDAGDIILCSRDVTQNADLLGYPAIVPKDGNYYLGSNLYKIISINKYQNTYLYYFFKSKFFRNWVKGIANGANVLMLNQRDLKSLRILIPENDLLCDFFKIINPLDKLIENLYTENATLRKIRDLLLPQLVNGEIEV